MHVAICDDNIADRKQMERLLGRESDKLAKDNVILYIDSYGNPEALLSAQMHYGVYFIDLTFSQLDGKPVNGLDLARMLRETGIDSTIFLCCGQIDYHTMELAPRIFCIDKPIRVQELSHAIQQAADELATLVPRIEFRTISHGTFYASYEEILYFHELSDCQSTLYLTDGRSIQVPEHVKNLYLNIQPAHPDLLAVSLKFALNPQHLQSAGLTTITFTNGTVKKIGLRAARYARKELKRRRKRAG